MKRSSVKRVAVTILVTLSLSATLTLYGQQDRREKASLKIVQLLNILDDNYIDTLNFTEISEETTRYILSLLDPHSTYIGAEDVKRSNEPLEGSFEGIGIEFAIIRDTLTVISTIVGGPSEKVGLRAGDQIVAVDGEPIASVKLTNSDVYKYLRGAGGTRVILKVVRRGSEELLTFTIVRGKIPINSVDASYMLEEGVAYVKLSRFASNSAREIIEAIMALGDHSKLKGMVLDLRSNSGGYLGSAIEIANFFLERGETIVSIEGRKIKRVSEVAKGNGFFRKGALAIVVDQYSASASEIVAGAIQDWDRGAIFGRATFGKGLVQQPFNLVDGSQVRVTVAHYLTPSGREIQTPYRKGESNEYFRKMEERYLRGEFFHKDTVKFDHSLKYKTLKEGREIYGGGGITPDIFIPADTSLYTPYYGRMVREGILLSFVNQYTQSNREKLLQLYPSFEEFNSHFLPKEQRLIEDLFEYGSKEGVEYNGKEAQRSMELFTLLVKGHIARTLYDENSYYRIVQELDRELFDALKEYFKEQLSQ